MVAVLAVFANHLWGWPRGGFVGVDVFFVISGFLITGNLLRSAETTGTVSFKRFYWNRVRRIVPAATVVMLLTYIASTLVFLPFRSNQVGIDALFAFVFASNWWSAHKGTDYFRVAADAVSPLQHYWSLSIEEQFYFVWPALIFLISALVIRKKWTHAHRMQLAGVVMALIVAASLWWALRETSTAATAAYFSTFARVWELGAGALLATCVTFLARIPIALRPMVSLLGLGAIAVSLYLVDGTWGFPAPWAILPVTGAALVIAAGVGGEPSYQQFLRNPISTYIGDISYSLYLVHWPVIVLLGAIMDPSPYYFVVAVALAFSLSIVSYHFVENPLRRADADTIHNLRRYVRKRQLMPARSTQYAAVGAAALLLVAMVAVSVQPVTPPTQSAAIMGAADTEASTPDLPPATAELHTEIVAALKANDWPALNPTMESVISGPQTSPDIAQCGGTGFPTTACTWGLPNAAVRVVLVGDSVGMTYAGPLKAIAEGSNGHIQVHSEAMFGCTFADDLIDNDDQRLSEACPGRKQHAVDVINATMPTIVFIANSYAKKTIQGSEVSLGDWARSLQRVVQKFPPGTRVVLLAAPPADVLISDCYGKRSSKPRDCISTVTKDWSANARTEQDLAKSLGAIWIDSRPWFCSNNRACPSFVGTTPTKMDTVHMAPAYGLKIAPAIAESLTAAGVL